MKESLFLNLTAHQLTDDQKERAKSKYSLAISFLDLRDINPDLYFRLTNQNSKTNLDFDVKLLLKEISKISADYTKVYAHFPIGSPAFLWKFARNALKFLPSHIQPVFSLSERCVEEKINDDNSVERKSVFRFVDFIEVGGRLDA